MRIAILGATSEIARDLINSLRVNKKYILSLFSRRPAELVSQLRYSSPINIPASYSLTEFSTSMKFDAILNFIGAGNPKLIADLSDSFVGLTQIYDQLALDYLKIHPHCRYIFMSSGSIFGGNFDKPIEAYTTVPKLNADSGSNQWYQNAKLAAEVAHRKLTDNPITDLRIFNYFSHTQSIESQSLMANIAKSLVNKSILEVSPEPIIRDFLHPDDFCRLVTSILEAPPENRAIDCYSKAPISKHDLLEGLCNQLGLQYKFSNVSSTLNPTGVKLHYYSNNRYAQKLGYEPKYSSLDGITLELKVLLKDMK
ncbi:NAD(P)-dependent oxidoreductase [Polynucleobacter sp. AP-Titi-500A-B4]|uniref:NAD-dependent epimerase/dehydratase family protein n=1 Tax=Polynucleobacter sp. AP-Titi-500A-B4 TaxID=2576923 RepID=UPI001BFD1675|nr:NAD(P)-dependent oxidoreductase [Polynucleobacter sp. AP-Titi-500A-B4]QWE12805.1 NAD(P)-dependent oxidoreductase [Polynucleobacter sp. AP-Titi-500A-B4]